MQEKSFEKYQTRGADYHWREINILNPITFNAYLRARYDTVSEAISGVLKKNSSREKELSIVDFGCGDGVQLYIIKNSFRNRSNKLNLYGIDLSSEAIGAAKKRLPKADFRIASTYESGFADNFSDITVSSDVIEHVLEPEKMFNEMIRITKPGGFIVIATPIRYTEFPLDPMHVQEFFPEQFSKLLKSSKTKIVLHILSHPLKKTLSYNHTTPIFGKNLPIWKYAVNILTILSGTNVFKKKVKHQDGKSPLMTYQLAILKKNG